MKKKTKKYDTYESIKELFLFACVIGLFFTATNIMHTIRLNKEFTAFTASKIALEQKLSEKETEINELRTEFEVFKQLTSDEFVLTWRATAQMHNNLNALGLGYHLEKEDIAEPDKEDDYEVAK